MKYEIQTTIEVNPTIRELAEMIWDLDSQEQAELIAVLMRIDKKWRVESQICEVAHELDEDGIEFFDEFNAYIGEVK